MSLRFEKDILKMNAMYKLPIAPKPTSLVGELASERLIKFKDILSEECTEIDEVIESYRAAPPVEESLTMLADLLGDIIVFCASEAAKFGIPIFEVLDIIMQSNFSKLGEDGKPIYDERGKVQKGPGYWKPEPKIRALLQARIAEHTVYEAGM